ncbi:MAG: putative baseplate assembly protein [Cyanobacteria bacterium P01_F01_bin.150]
MALDFLPNLPKAELDDRRYDDLLQECLQRIPRYCPEWTNYNPSEPGVTLLESFAWLTDQMLMRFNQVPRRHYVAFLELLGIRLQPPQAAIAHLTFYLVSELPEPYRIPAGTQVATERSASEAAIIFSTNQALTIGRPLVRHLLTAASVEEQPTVLRDRFSNVWNRSQEGQWNGPEINLFNEQPSANNCFYLVLEEGSTSLNGNVLALTINGQAATPAGINPFQPPRRWQAWDGVQWRSVLLSEADDQTQGFSFAALVAQGGNPIQGADIVLHLPLSLPVTQFASYRGHWLRCVCDSPEEGQAPYRQSPRITGISVRSIGGTVSGSQCEMITEEVLGESNGSPGQVFQLRGVPVLTRKPDETITVTLPNREVEVWQEVPDFAASGPGDRHYVIDSITGMVQFGPRVREPSQLRQRSELQTRFLTHGLGQRLNQGFADEVEGTLLSAEMSTEISTEISAEMMVSPEAGRRELSLNSLQTELRSLHQQERQYGAIPPKGAVIRMGQYRTGGGEQGNVQAQSLTVLKSAIPYVARVTNYQPARQGSNAESLEQAAIRVPQLLRTHNRAVTPEDFEQLARQGGQGAIARAHCLPPDTPGIVQLMLVPRVDGISVEQDQGISPQQLALRPELEQQVTAYLDRRRLLGCQIQCREPEYIGVTVQTEVSLDPAWRSAEGQTQVVERLRTLLYYFLNPLTGGRYRRGWPIGQVLYQSDIVSLLQASPGIRYLGAVQLFKLEREGNRWIRQPPSPRIDPGPLGMICSWADPTIHSGHSVSVVND